MKIRFLCPICGSWTVTRQVDAESCPCAHCRHVVTAAAPSTAAALTGCRVCGNQELYVQKDFPHWLGMSILVVACIASVVTYALYYIKTTWTILIGSATVDGLLYLLMGDVTVCYRCRAQYRGFPPNPEHHAFDLAIGEKYRQERLRKDGIGH
jgi:hypothetical protein